MAKPKLTLGEISRLATCKQAGEKLSPREARALAEFEGAVNALLVGATSKLRKPIDAFKEQMKVVPWQEVMSNLEREAAAVDAIRGHLEAMLADERLLASPVTHKQMSAIVGDIMNASIGHLDMVRHSVAKKVEASRAARARAIAYRAQRVAVIAYYQVTKVDYRDKESAAFGIEGKILDGIEITAKLSTIRRWLWTCAHY